MGQQAISDACGSIGLPASNALPVANTNREDKGAASVEYDVVPVHTEEEELLSAAGHTIAV